MTDNDYCDECGSLDLKVGQAIWDEDANLYSVVVECRECGSEWVDWVDDE